MTFSPEWEEANTSQRMSKGRIPMLEIVIGRFVTEAERVLEFGTGIGSNLQYFLTEMGADYYGIEGSLFAVASVLERYPELTGKIHCGDFTREQPFGTGFDLVVDRASIAHNDITSIKRALDFAWEALKPGGLFISVDWFSTRHSEYTRGEKVEIGTRRDYPDGQFAGIGIVHFSDQMELRALFDRFDRVHLQERCEIRMAAGAFLEQAVHRKWISPAFNAIDYCSAVWDLVVRKPL